MKTIKSQAVTKCYKSEFHRRITVWTSSVRNFLAPHCATSTILALACLLFVALPARGQSGTNQQSVLVVTIFDQGYAPYMSNYYQAAQQASGTNAAYVRITSDGTVGLILAAAHFDQVWLFDMSSSSDSFLKNWQAIANWFNTNASRGIICDGRLLGSYAAPTLPAEGKKLAENYYENLKRAGGGIILGTDDMNFHDGINTVNNLIGLRPFSNLFAASMLPVDTNSPVMYFPNDMGVSIADSTTTGQAPFGLQPNGCTLYPIAWHTRNPSTPGISTTVNSASSYRVRIISPLTGTSFAKGSPVTFSATTTNDVPPSVLEWTSDRDGALGSGSNLVVSSLSPGAHVITVSASDATNQISVASVRITVNPSANIATAVEIWWESQSGATYQVQWASVLNSNIWQNLGSPVVATGTNTTTFDSTRQATKRFYRVIQQ